LSLNIYPVLNDNLFAVPSHCIRTIFAIMTKNAKEMRTQCEHNANTIPI